jgi:hypothetical protein
VNRKKLLLSIATFSGAVATFFLVLILLNRKDSDRPQAPSQVENESPQNGTSLDEFRLQPEEVNESLAKAPTQSTAVDSKGENDATYSTAAPAGVADDRNTLRTPSRAQGESQKVDILVLIDPTDPEHFELLSKSAELEVVAPAMRGAISLKSLAIPVDQCDYQRHETKVVSRSPSTVANLKHDGVTTYDDLLEYDQRGRVQRVRLNLQAKRVEEQASFIRARLSVVLRCAKR